MTLLLFTLLFCIGVTLMLYGADQLVGGGSSIAAHYRISPLVIGLTIVSFGTSFPEFAASLASVIHGQTDMAMGNVIGSNICNLALVLGAAALTHPIQIHSGILRKEIPFVLLASLLMWLMALNHLITRAEGATLVFLFLLFVWYCIVSAKKENARVLSEETTVEAASPAQGMLKVVVGLGLLFLGADLGIRSAVWIAERFGVSQALIGLTIIALGTSLPELVTSVVALKKGEGEIGLGNVLGSNLFNILFVLGTISVIRPIPSSPQFSRLDIPVMMALTFVLVPIARYQKKVGRGEGAFLFSAYVIYILFHIIRHVSMEGS